MNGETKITFHEMWLVVRDKRLRCPWLSTTMTEVLDNAATLVALRHCMILNNRARFVLQRTRRSLTSPMSQFTDARISSGLQGRIEERDSEWEEQNELQLERRYRDPQAHAISSVCSRAYLGSRKSFSPSIITEAAFDRGSKTDVHMRTDWWGPLQHQSYPRASRRLSHT